MTNACSSATVLTVPSSALIFDRAGDRHDVGEVRDLGEKAADFQLRIHAGLQRR